MLYQNKTGEPRIARATILSSPWVFGSQFRIDHKKRKHAYLECTPLSQSLPLSTPDASGLPSFSVPERGLANRNHYPTPTTQTLHAPFPLENDCKRDRSLFQPRDLPGMQPANRIESGCRGEEGANSVPLRGNCFRRFVGFLKLEPMKSSVQPTTGHQLLMSPRVQNAARMHHNDLIGQG